VYAVGNLGTQDLAEAIYLQALPFDILEQKVAKARQEYEKKSTARRQKRLETFEEAWAASHSTARINLKANAWDFKVFGTYFLVRPNEAIGTNQFQRRQDGSHFPGYPMAGKGVLSTSHSRSSEP
jgi:hypothetical protein